MVKRMAGRHSRATGADFGPLFAVIGSIACIKFDGAILFGRAAV